jgi:hypothetical protein
MASWAGVEKAAPALAGMARARFDAHGLGLLATLRRDGSPRISGIEPLFADGELWLGMMPDSRKAADLRRDRRFALHNATIDKQVTDGDAKVAGEAIPVDTQETMERFRQAFERHTGYPPPDGPIGLFLADVRDVSMMRPAGDHLDIEWWREGEGVKGVERR